MRIWISMITVMTLAGSVAAQERSMQQDPSLDNLVHHEGYRTIPLGTFGHVERRGSGPMPMILVPGGGFGWNVFEGFMARNEERYTMYAVSLAGMGGTPAPPMPPPGTSYGERTWMRGAVRAVLDLIEREELERPVFVGHFLEGSQIGLRMAIDQPDRIRGVVLLGGAVRMAQPGQQYTLEQIVRYQDENMAPRWFKTVTLKTWNDNNFPPEVYSRDPKLGADLFDQVDDGPLPVFVRYLLEFWAADFSLEFDEIASPVLLLSPSFPEEMLEAEATSWLSYYFVDGWRGIEKNPRVTIEPIEDAHIFVWLDQPQQVDEAIERFVGRVGQ